MIYQFGYASISCCIKETIIAGDVIDVGMQSLAYTTKADAKEILVGRRVTDQE